MNWDGLIGQAAVKNYLRAVLVGGRQAHAFLFKGPSGVGKRTAAWIFAQVALCQQRPAPDEACGHCRSCRWFESRQGYVTEHPDVISLLKPEFISPKVAPASAPAGTNLRAEKELTADTARQRLIGDHEPIIRLETMQFVCEQLHRSPIAGRRRVVIIPEAQRLCRGQAEAANAFLKTLEEPPEPAVIIMTSSQPEALLETIISRAQGVQFRRLSADDVRVGLARQAAQAPEAERELAVQLADGSLGRALELLSGDLRKWRMAVVNALGKFDPKAGPQLGLMLWALADAEGKRLFDAGKQQAESAEEDGEGEDSGEAASAAEVKTESGWKRYVFRRLLEVAEVCFRDGAVCAAAPAAGAAVLLQPDQRELAQTLAARFGQDGCLRILAALREALLAVRLYVRGDVIGRALSGKLVEAFGVPA
ncbi:MAG TPA: hypothetical protein VGP72_29350 [Planctomycetota bacterium]|jgi:DNA polymerase III delta prime subunit